MSLAICKRCNGWGWLIKKPGRPAKECSGVPRFGSAVVNRNELTRRLVMY